MRTIEREVEPITRFKRDYKREKKGRHHATLDADLLAVLLELVNDRVLTPHCHDHPLTGNWKDYRDCHVKPDLVLIYQLPDNDTLRLIRLSCGAWIVDIISAPDSGSPGGH